MLNYERVDHEADPYSVANTIALNALVARAKSKGELLAHLKGLRMMLPMQLFFAFKKKV